MRYLFLSCLFALALAAQTSTVNIPIAAGTDNGYWDVYPSSYPPPSSATGWSDTQNIMPARQAKYAGGAMETQIQFFRFNTNGQVPTGASITGATLTFAVINNTSPNLAYCQYDVRYSPSMSYPTSQTNGYASTATGTVAYQGWPSGTGSVTLTLTNLSGIVTNGYTQFRGWVNCSSAPTGDNFLNMDTSQSGNSPVLSITYQQLSHPHLIISNIH